MRTAGRLLLLAGVILLLMAINDERRGVASVMPPGRSTIVETAARSQNPRDFDNLMTYQWIRAFLAFFAGTILLHLNRNAEKLDPLSPDFEDHGTLDELSEELDKEHRSGRM